MDDWKSTLRSEFSAEPGSFLLQMRCDLVWDANALDRLVTAMEICCRATAGEEIVERWIGDCFWYVSFSVKDWTTHPNFPRNWGDEYYETAYEYLFDLASWFFQDACPWTDNGVRASAEFHRMRAIPAAINSKD